MRGLTEQEIHLISGGTDKNEENGYFDICMVIGTTAGFFGGIYYSTSILKKYPCVVLLPGAIEQILSIGAVGGTVAGAVIGAFTGFVIDNT